jgi:pyruvate carboxylase
MVKRVVKEANYKEDKKMIPVREGELIVELCPIPNICQDCAKPLSGNGSTFCPWCGKQIL